MKAHIASSLRQAWAAFKDGTTTECRPAHIRDAARHGTETQARATHSGSAPNPGPVRNDSPRGFCKKRTVRYHRIGVELTPHCLQESVPRSRVHHRRPIGTVRCHSVVRVGDGDDPRDHWDVGTKNAVGVTVTIDPFVMVTDDQRDVSRTLRPFDRIRSPISEWRPISSALLEGEAPLLIEHRGRQTDLPDVVDEAGDIRALLLLRGRPSVSLCRVCKWPLHGNDPR